MMSKSASCIAGGVGLLAGLYLFSNSEALNWIVEALHSLPQARAAWFVKPAFWSLMSLCLTSGVLALLTLDRPDTSWQHLLGVIGTVVTLLGLTAYLIGCFYLIILLVERYAYFLSQGFPYA
jgi:hypothetical protein